jgi:transposase-like protein
MSFNFSDEQRKELKEKVESYKGKMGEKDYARYQACMKEYITGRPTKFDPVEQLPKIFAWFSEGQTIAQVAANLGIAKSTYYKWIEQYPMFSDFHKKGRALSRASLEQLSFDNIMNPKFQFLVAESRMRREYSSDEVSGIDVPGFKEAKTDQEKIDCIVSSLADGNLSTRQANDLIGLMKGVKDLVEMDSLIARLSDLENKIKDT